MVVVPRAQHPKSKGGNASSVMNKTDLVGDSSKSSGEGDGSSSDETSFHESGSVDHKAAEVKEVQKLSRWETLGVRFWRSVVLILLIIAGVLVSTGTYLFLRNAEQVEYVNRYILFTGTIGDASQFHIMNMHQALRSLSETITSSAWATDSTFPYVTPPIFEVHAYHARVKSGAEGILYAPLIMSLNDVPAWNNYSVENQGWVAESRETVKSGAENATHFLDGSIMPFIWDTETYESLNPVPVSGDGPFWPVWLMSPPPLRPEFINLNAGTAAEFYPILSLAREGVFSDVQDLGAVAALAVSTEDHVDVHLKYGSNVTAETAFKRPHSFLVSPVFEELNDPKAKMVGVLLSVVSWDRYLANLLPEGVNGIVCVLKNSCGQSYTYVVNGNGASYLGEGDFHDPRYRSTEVNIPLFDYLYPNRTSRVRGHCEYRLFVYASSEYQTSTSSNTPVIFTSVVAVTFFLVVVTFVVYDMFVQRRNSKVEDAAIRSNVILSSLFPTTIRDRLIAGKHDDDAKNGKSAGGAKTRLRSFLDSDKPGGLDAAVSDDLGYEGKPIADLFPETTIMFMDISGFTAWSSVREPCQVFTLLETLYRSFDEIAKRRRVFKVETVGDCYVAVTGLPDPRKDHAVAMARFARDCMQRARQLTKKLEVTLGPDTGDLTMRAGLHSGPVTAGVLRGERSRFQLFGDCMNTASRMESTGLPGRIQISQDTAELLISAGKVAWITKRDEKVVAKGKGEMQTYWLSPGEQGSDKASSHETASSHSESNASERGDLEAEGTADGQVVMKSVAVNAGKQKRLIEWNVDVLLRLLKQIVARRRACGLSEHGSNCVESKVQFVEPGKTVIDEVREIIVLPKFNAKAATKHEDPDSIVLPGEVVEQMYDYVANIASIYNDSNPFHNFEHASHVTMSVVKLLSRIVAPSDVEYDENMAKQGKTLHDHTYGITSDPLTQFACVFSALIHDADHSGAPNMQLVKEKTFIAEFYKGQSVAEQNSVDLSWQLLMDSAYDELRHTIYSNEAELKRFRQLVVNSVMATDIVDKELKTLRNARWTNAFSEDALKENETEGLRVNRKATIVIEHLIQASDVAHTMQHWHIYRKWNERFFMECYKAYKEGRAENDPSEGWYQGELGFYDFYIIPLAKKLKDCGVFGVSSDEYLNYAVRNRKEWEERGHEVVNEMVQKVSQMSFDAPSHHRAGGI